MDSIDAVAVEIVGGGFKRVHSHVASACSPQLRDALMKLELESPSYRCTHWHHHCWDFVAEVVRRSGCYILCDVNNIYINSVNHGFNPHAYLRALPGAAISAARFPFIKQSRAGCDHLAAKEEMAL